MDDVFGDHKTQAYALRVHLARSLDGAKQFEQLTLLVDWYTDAGIYNRDDDLVELGVRLHDALETLLERLLAQLSTVATLLRPSHALAGIAFQVVVFAFAFLATSSPLAANVLAHYSDLAIFLREFERV